MFKDQVVWITGASSGIGESMAVAWAKAGAKLVLSARRRDELERVAKACGTSDILIHPLDLASGSDFEADTRAVLSRFGRIDVVVHNGGISQRSWVKDTAMDVHRRIMEVNYFGAIALTKATLPTMLEAKRGHVVVISSVMGKIGTPLRSAYAASKHALHGYYDCLRAEVADSNVNVTVICPGFVSTNVSKNALTADGSPTNKTGDDIANGISPDVAAAQILNAVRAKKSEAYVGRIGKDRLALTLQRFAPGVLERLVRNQVPK
ncbi:MAG: SDR family oxidoreductase [Archangium sp.]